MTPSEWTNSEWLEALKADGESAWAALRGRVVRGLLGYLHSNRLSGIEGRALQALVEDAAQETLLTVRAKLGSFRGESRLTTWVYRIAVNALLTELRRRRWERRSTADPSEALPDWPLEDQAPDPEREVLQRDAWGVIRGLIERELTPHQRGILLAHVFHHKPLDLVAADLGISRDAVYKAIHDARRNLRAALLAKGITLEETLAIFEGKIWPESGVYRDRDER
jgi:RNA polymerase sigma-70 factor (ECF subfamily)